MIGKAKLREIKGSKGKLMNKSGDKSGHKKRLNIRKDKKIRYMD